MVVQSVTMPCCLLTLFQEGPHKKLFFQEKNQKFCKKVGKLNHCRYCQVPLLSLATNFFLSFFG